MTQCFGSCFRTFMNSTFPPASSTRCGCLQYTLCFINACSWRYPCRHLFINRSIDIATAYMIDKNHTSHSNMTCFYPYPLTAKRSEFWWSSNAASYHWWVGVDGPFRMLCLKIPVPAAESRHPQNHRQRCWACSASPLWVSPTVVWDMIYLCV